MKIFGGSKSSSSTGNKAFDYLKTTFSPTAGMTSGVSNALAGLLGIGGDPAAASAAFDNFRNSTGYQFQLGEGMNAITSNAATRGLLNSGATVKAAQQYGQNLASNYFSNYLSQLGGLGTMGLQAGQLISGAGQTSQSKGREYSGGLGDFIGGAAGMIFSDVRLKDNVELVATDENGLRYYEWDWNDDARDKFGLEGRGFGVLAQDLLTSPYSHAIDAHDGYFAVRYNDLPEPTELQEIA